MDIDLPKAAKEPQHGQHLPTRQQAIARVKAAHSWSELFCAAGEALSCDRSAWGDEFEQSKEAALAWASAEFVVRAGASVESRFERRTKIAGRKSVKGTDLLDSSMKVAKEVALLLLAPLPPVRRGADGEPKLLLRKYKIDKILKNVRQALFDQAHALPQRDDPHIPNWERPQVENDAIFLLVGTDFLGTWSGGRKAEGFKNAIASDPWHDAQDWEGLSNALGWQPGADRIDKARLEVAFDDVMAKGGFAWLSCGTQGGIDGMLSSAELLGAESAKLSIKAGLPRLPVAALGTAGLVLNSCGEWGSTLGSFNGMLWTITASRGSKEGVLPHEWTHALDRLTKSTAKAAAQGRPANPVEMALARAAIEANEKLEALESSIANMPACKESWATVESRTQDMLNDRHFRMRRMIVMSLKKNGSIPGITKEDQLKRRSEALRVADGIHALAIDGAKSVDSAAELIQNALGRRIGVAKQYLAPTLDDIGFHLSIAKAGIDMKQQGVPAFVAAARIDDLERAKREESAKPYHATPSELLARIGEAVLGLGNNSDLRANTQLYSGHPLPSAIELAAIRPLFMDWVKSCEPLIVAATKSHAKQEEMRATQKPAMGSFEKLASKFIFGWKAATNPQDSQGSSADRDARPRP